MSATRQFILSAAYQHAPANIRLAGCCKCVDYSTWGMPLIGGAIALQHYRDAYPHDPHVLTVSSFLNQFPVATRLIHMDCRCSNTCLYYL
jgi:hypothetical protein